MAMLLFLTNGSTPGKSVENLNVVNIPEDSIVVLLQQDTAVSGYVHTRYAFNRLGELKLVDYYGSAIDPNDESVIQFERAMCSRQEMNDYDGSNE